MIQGDSKLAPSPWVPVISGRQGKEPSRKHQIPCPRSKAGFPWGAASEDLQYSHGTDTVPRECHWGRTTGDAFKVLNPTLSVSGPLWFVAWKIFNGLEGRG